jgi:hypothetical protein
LFWNADYAPEFRIVAIGCFADPTFPRHRSHSTSSRGIRGSPFGKDLPTFEADASPEEIAAVLTKR